MNFEDSLQYCERCNAHYSMEKFSNHFCHKVLTDEELLVQRYSELTPAQIRIYSEKNPVFKRNYTRMKKEGSL